MTPKSTKGGGPVLTAADYLNYANAIHQYLTLFDRFIHTDFKNRSLKVAVDILNIVDPLQPSATVLKLVPKDNPNE